jgi:hypothetical protein
MYASEDRIDDLKGRSASDSIGSQSVAGRRGLSKHGGNHGNQYTEGKRQGGNATLAANEKNTVKHILARLERYGFVELATSQRVGGEVGGFIAAPLINGANGTFFSIIFLGATGIC